jgi:hypothetical protein
MLRWVLLVLVLLVAAGMGWQASGNLRQRRDSTRGLVEQKASIINETMRMYVTDFHAFPPTSNAEGTRELLTPYIPIGVRDWLFSSPPAFSEVAPEFRFAPGLPARQVRDPRGFETARFRHRHAGVLATYIDGHTAWIED